jgi:hypothetical protein
MESGPAPRQGLARILSCSWIHGQENKAMRVEGRGVATDAATDAATDTATDVWEAGGDGAAFDT